MYIPKHFEQNDKQKSIAFMQTYNFAIVVSVKNEIPIATHLPFVIEERNDKIILLSHLSKANEQHTTFSDTDVLVIFPSHMRIFHQRFMKNSKTFRHGIIFRYMLMEK